MPLFPYLTYFDVVRYFNNELYFVLFIRLEIGINLNFLTSIFVFALRFLRLCKIRRSRGILMNLKNLIGRNLRPNISKIHIPPSTYNIFAVRNYPQFFLMSEFRCVLGLFPRFNQLSNSNLWKFYLNMELMGDLFSFY